MVKDISSRLQAMAARLDYIVRSKNGLTQTEIANIAGVSQPFVSRALNGKLVRETKRAAKMSAVVDRLYANIRDRDPKTPKVVGEAIKDYLAAGGDPDLLIRQVGVLRQALGPFRRSELPSLDESE